MLFHNLHNMVGDRHLPLQVLLRCHPEDKPPVAAVLVARRSSVVVAFCLAPLAAADGSDGFELLLQCLGGGCFAPGGEVMQPKRPRFGGTA